MGSTPARIAGCRSLSVRLRTKRRNRTPPAKLIPCSQATAARNDRDFMALSPQPSLARLIALTSPTLARADDATLGRAACAGDPRATSVLWDRFSPLVRRMLLRTLGPTAEIETLLQGVFRRTLHQLGALPDVAQLKPFVVAVTVGMLRRELKRNRLRRLLGLRGRRHTSAFSSGDVATHTALSALYGILNELDAEARLTFTLFHFEGLQITDLAVAMDASLSSAKRRLASANAQVQAALNHSAALKAYAAATRAAR